VVPALWGRIPDEQWQNHEPYCPPHDKGDYHAQDVHPPDDCRQHPDQTVEVTHVEQKKKWTDIDDNRKKQLEVGGGLLAGAALIGGGYLAWQHHQKKTEEEKQELTWGAQSWQTDAYARTEEFRNHGPRSPTSWVLVEGREKIPRSALEAGKDKDGNSIYIARAFFEGGTQIGKASRGFKAGAAIGYAGSVVELNKFEVLIGDSRGIQWVRFSSQLSIQRLGATPVEGGREADGKPLYVARVEYEHGWHTAKVGEHLPAAQLAFGGREVTITEYEVLCLN